MVRNGRSSPHGGDRHLYGSVGVTGHDERLFAVLWVMRQGLSLTV